jgi:Domain of unknown function (DUF6777)
VEGIAGTNTAVATFVRRLKPATLPVDTRVTDYSYAHGQAYSFPAILQTGTAVLVDASGNLLVRCRCGNPLSYPVLYAVEHCLGCTTGYRLPQPKTAYAYVVYPAPPPVRGQSSVAKPTIVSKGSQHRKRKKPPRERTRTVTVVQTVAVPAQTSVLTTTVPSTVTQFETRILTIPHVIYQTRTVIRTVTEVATHAG